MGKVGDAFVEVSTKTTRFQKGMAAVRATLAKIGPALAAVAVTAAALGTVALGRTAVQGIRLYSDAIEDAGKFTVVFGADAERVKTSINEFAKATGRSGTELQALAGNTGDVIKALGIESSVAADLSVELTKLAVDVASFKNASEPEVIKAFTSALTGERESLKSLGIVINETQVKAEAFTSGIAKQGETLTSAQKAMATYQLLLSRTTDAQGDATKTAGSLQNIFRRVGAAFRDFQRVLGKILVNTLGLEKLGQIAAIAFELMSEGLKRVTAGLSQAGGGKKFRAGLIKAFRGVAKAGAILFRVVQIIGKALAGILKIVGFLISPLGILGDSFANLINAKDSAAIDRFFDQLEAASNQTTKAVVADGKEREGALAKEATAAKRAAAAKKAEAALTPAEAKKAAKAAAKVAERQEKALKLRKQLGRISDAVVDTGERRAAVSARTISGVGAAQTRFQELASQAREDELSAVEDAAKKAQDQRKTLISQLDKLIAAGEQPAFSTA